MDSKLVFRKKPLNGLVVRKFKRFYRALVATFGAGLLWALWASAQTAVGPATIEFTRNLFDASENISPAKVGIRRTGNTNSTSTVDFATHPESAREGADFLAKSGQVIFAPGQIEQTIAVPIIDNFDVDGSRRFRITLTNPVGGTLGPLSTTEVEIQDNDFARSGWVTFGLNRVPALQHLVFGIPLWQYLASFIYVFLAFYLSKFLDYFIRARLLRWAQKTKTRWDDLLVEILRGPAKVVVFVLLLHLGLRIFSWPEWIQ